jgi:hypothetical protein
MKDRPEITSIEHKFLDPGHTHMECDADHGKIEKKQKKTTNHESNFSSIRLAGACTFLRLYYLKYDLRAAKIPLCKNFAWWAQKCLFCGKIFERSNMSLNLALIQLCDFSRMRNIKKSIEARKLEGLSSPTHQCYTLQTVQTPSDFEEKV